MEVATLSICNGSCWRAIIHDMHFRQPAAEEILLHGDRTLGQTNEIRRHRGCR
ncbi:unnamed protein product [Ectocarpus sp. 4 AP-2014]